jgi:hypothetical protein
MDQNQQILTCPTNHKKFGAIFVGQFSKLGRNQHKTRLENGGELQFRDQPLLLIPNDIG